MYVKCGQSYSYEMMQQMLFKWGHSHAARNEIRKVFICIQYVLCPWCAHCTPRWHFLGTYKAIYGLGDTLFTSTWNCHSVFYVNFWHTFLQCPQFNFKWNSNSNSIRSLVVYHFYFFYFHHHVKSAESCETFHINGGPFVCKYCTYVEMVVEVFHAYHPKKRRKIFICMCICRCNARTETQPRRTNTLSNALLGETLFLPDIFSWLYFPFNTIQLSSEILLYIPHMWLTYFITSHFSNDDWKCEWMWSCFKWNMLTWIVHLEKISIFIIVRCFSCLKFDTTQMRQRHICIKF